MKSPKAFISEALVKEGVNYITKNPLENMPKLLSWAEKIAIKDQHKNWVQMFKKWYDDKESAQYRIIERVCEQLDSNCLKKLLINYFVNAGMIGIPTNDKMKEANGCNIPWAILMDPTSACNLKCKGCWAGEYKKTDMMSYELLDSIIRQGKELGIYMYIYSGGEPLVRKDDLVRLAEAHNDCMFLSFTNGTLIDEDFARKIQRAGNFLFAISIEGFEKETDMRRGEGTYKRVIQAMDILKKYGIGFGLSACYHHFNTDIMSSDEFTDFMIEKGCIFAWYFTYVPVGKDADLSLLATPEDREKMYHAVRRFRATKPLFVMDFWNDGEYVGGCIAGGRNYLHINANGDVEPCAFIHYSNANIREVSLLDALKSPIFKQYNKSQPFNENQLRPCPMLDNPEKLRQMVKESGAHSTQPLDNEDVDDLCNKCLTPSEKWAPVAERLWAENRKLREESKAAKDLAAK